MRQDKYKQAIVIAEKDAASFERKLNEALNRVTNPEIQIDNNLPFTAYILYSVCRDVPESVLELFELLDGCSHSCIECPHFVEPTDKRCKWGSCTLRIEKTRGESRACEHFYVWRLKEIEQAEKLYKELPFTIE